MLMAWVSLAIRDCKRDATWLRLLPSLSSFESAERRKGTDGAEGRPHPCEAPDRGVMADWLRASGRWTLLARVAFTRARGLGWLEPREVGSRDRAGNEATL